MQDKILSAIGLAKRAGKAICGTQLVRDSAKSGKAKLIIVASDASDRSKKEITDTSAFYKTECIISCYTMAQLSSAVGLMRSTSSVAITDENMTILVKNSINNQM